MSSSKSLLLFIIASFAAVCVQAQSHELRKITMDQYIETYSELAIKEMERTGIPASIKMAQAILESGFGNSELATKARNHFGIKCHVGWTGPSVRMDDDEENECFRKYRRVEESFLDHSEFLTTRPRYAFLFDLKQTDYKNWARGLQRAGYATNPSYANLLIRLIEEKDLHLLDTQGRDRLIAQQKDKPAASPEDFEGRIMTFNNIKTVVAQPDETLFDIAMQHGIRLPRLLRYNDIDEEEDYQLTKGELVFLQPKRRRGNERFHIVEEGQTMREVSQKQGIRLNRLLRRNRMDEDEEAKQGERLVLRGRRHEKPAVLSPEEAIALRTGRISETEKEKTDKRKEQPLKRAESRPEVFVSITEPDIQDSRKVVSAAGHEEPIDRIHTYQPDTPEVSTTDDPAVKTSEDPVKTAVEPQEPVVSSSENIERVNPDEMPGNNIPAYHTVLSGETLYRISLKYNIPVHRLKELNNLQTNNLSPGDRLVLKEVNADPPTQLTAEKQTGQTTTQQAPESKPRIHRVEHGQTFYTISRLYGVSLEQLRQWNNVNESALSVGQKIIVGYPDKTVQQSTAETKPAEVSKPKYHEVEAGQTLFSIARMHQITVAQLRDWNNLNSDNLSIGQRLIVQQ